MKILGRAADRDVYIVEMSVLDYRRLEKYEGIPDAERCAHIDEVVRSAWSDVHSALDKLETIRRPS